jgi:RND family efflux transporter MFP subunit
MLKNIIRYAFLPLLVILVFTYCATNTKEETAPNLPGSEEVVPVKLAPVAPLSGAAKVSAAGLIFSDREARLAFKTGGIIQKLYVDEGDAVQAGQLLATLDLTEISASVAQAQLGLGKAERDLQRAKNLLADSVATKEQVQNATTAVDLAKQNLSIANFNRQFSEIRAPAAGRIVRKLANEGEVTGPGTPVFFLNLTGGQNWVLRVGVADKDWARIQLGDPALLHLDAFPGQPLPAKVSSKAEAADPTSGSFQIELTLPATDKRLASGLFAKAEISPKTSASLKTVPVEAVQEGNGKQAFVFITEDKLTVKKIPVTVAYLTKDYVAISEGLEQVQEVISAGSPYLTAQSKIKVLP